MNYGAIPSPCYVLEESKLLKNLQLMERVQQEAKIDIILAFKGFAMWSAFPLVKKFLRGATASSLHEAKLCFEEMGSKAHTYCVAYKPSEFDEVASLSSHLIFNSISQYQSLRSRIPQDVSCGIRVNPQWSDVATDLYNPASPTSRLGVSPDVLEDGLPEGIEGLHFHVLCESDSYALEKVLASLERRFAKCLSMAKWVNMGGGHLMTREGYDIAHLISVLQKFKRDHQVEIVLEPGSAVAWQVGFLRTTILDIVENGGVKTIIPDTSFTCHMPDTLEMPYRPTIVGTTNDYTVYKYRIGGVSCLAGDFLDTYNFQSEPQIGDDMIFEDMIHYTTVKTTTFNGVQHPSIGIWRDEKFELVREFGYEDYKNRLS